MAFFSKSAQHSFAQVILHNFEGCCARHVQRGVDPQFACLWMFLDHVLLIYQEPVYVTIGLRERKRYRPLFSNISEQDRDFLGLRLLDAEPLKDEIDAVCVECTADGIRVAIRYLPTTGQKPKQPAGLSNGLSRRIVKDLYERSAY